MKNGRGRAGFWQFWQYRGYACLKTHPRARVSDSRISIYLYINNLPHFLSFFQFENMQGAGAAKTAKTAEARPWL
jgi:hypothetical protein